MKEIDYNYGECEVTCDTCGNYMTFDDTNYTEINEKLKDNKWIIKNINNEWLDFCCKECYLKYIASNK